MAQKINALPDVNREDNTPQVTGYIPAKDMGGDVRYSDVDRNPALPDANQERVLPTVQISTGSPLMTDGRYETINKRGDTGRIISPTTPLAVGPQYENIVTTKTYLSDDSDGGPKSNSL